ncbi:hypothetical protein VF14_35055 [Nostoc linckia z18]|uniref:Uncharacterized protein n=2 Tax=Nostoc linckia TaxID=92942 RepID=A0A9Q5Z4M8_NOSLI|nr:hypothetical protein [Nostoc linckia]PHJ56383.1 hypothetical protein VF05_37355 [Nostoc linckia z3]PHJ56737.1 hypothetical protein VF03_37260 [Nostoc linckia z2]PHJ71238.1 hypothetical protein VF06_37370 [Nostoc linckia z4]PHJ75609.1 hypothetical protein VF07_37310 [Nostoc linckia z6]PHJ84979.1 hypothetical protein VF04_35910 [Nostoc linckia z7]
MISRRELLASLPVVLVAAVTPKRTDDYSPLPIPQFRIGQRVKTWHDLEGFPELVEETGTVKGLWWQPEGWRIEVGWVYHVWFPPNQLLESDTYWADIPEFDLEAC